MFVQKFTFNPFKENTYLLYTDTKEAVIIDAGCQILEERNLLFQFILEKELKITHLLNTHCHLDHVFGNFFCKKKYNIPLYAHQNEVPVLNSCPQVAEMYGFRPYDHLDKIDVFIDEKQEILVGNEVLKILFVPGHAPGHLAFWHEEDNFVISGDVLFKESIGRTDFPLCSHTDLMNSIKNVLFLLPDDCKVYCGHGHETTIGHEKKHNSYLV
jgi:hydroxyacylglutathione hydrolase